MTHGTADESALSEVERRVVEEIDEFETGVSSDEVTPAVANLTITELSRVRTRLNLVQAGQFEQDSAVSRQPVPRYTPVEQFDTGACNTDECRFLTRQLQREQNSVVYELEQALGKIPTA